MSEVLIYTSSYCGYCLAAKAKLDALGVIYQEIDVGRDKKQRQELMRKSGGRRTVPQIFIDGESIGGYMDLMALQRSGELDQLLQ